jgi:hypothetical protein
LPAFFSLYSIFAFPSMAKEGKRSAYLWCDVFEEN